MADTARRTVTVSFDVELPAGETRGEFEDTLVSFAFGWQWLNRQAIDDGLIVQDTILVESIEVPDED